MTQILKQSTAVDVLIGPFVDSVDGYSAESGISPAVKLSKNGQALAAKNDATTPVHDADGYYNCELDATDTNTIGTLVLSVVGSATSLPVRHEYQVIDGTVYDALYGSSGTFITSADLGIMYEGAVSTVNSVISFDMDTGIVTDDSWLGMTAVIEDVSTGDFYSTYITDVDQANDRLVIASSPFTVQVGDKIRVYREYHPYYALITYDAAKGTDTINANITKVNSVTVTGTGTESDPWGP